MSVCPACAVTVESLALETSFVGQVTSLFVCGYIGQDRISRSSGEGQGHISEENHSVTTCAHSRMVLSAFA